MKEIVLVQITKGGTYYVGECLDFPVVTQGKTLDELRANLEEAISLYFENENTGTAEVLPPGIEQGLADIKQGRSFGPFDADQAAHWLKDEAETGTENDH